MLSSLCNLSKRTVSNNLTHPLSNKRIQVSSEPIDKIPRTFSSNSTRNETEQSSKIPVDFVI